MNEKDLESQSKAIFSGLKQVEPPPFFAARVMARLNERRDSKKQIHFWRWLAAGGLTTALALTVYLQVQPKPEVLFTYKPYVIRVELNEQELKMAANAELELPEGVSFASRNEAVRELRQLRLPATASFVIVAEKTGAIPLEVKLYDSENRLVLTKKLNLNFASPREG